MQQRKVPFGKSEMSIKVSIAYPRVSDEQQKEAGNLLWGQLSTWQGTFGFHSQATLRIDRH